MTATEGRTTEADVLATRPHPWQRAILWLSFLGPFFCVTFGFANWLTSLRSGVPEIVFEWEHRIPFLGWSVIPYLSVHLFFCLSLFLCRSREELDTLGNELLTAQIVAVICFIAFPFRDTFARPETTGFVGSLFSVLTIFDKPFNQAPSLHISTLVILRSHYARHVPRWGMMLVHVWFCLAGISVLTTFQHHFIDVPTGALLGLLCLRLWSYRGESPIALISCMHDRHRNG